ncbi:MAG: micrococcal nuclease [Candidatus Hydrogenedentes bacterium]|nr:micrococcal nuclease [Candidatus Hydrogenedentota bacterium]
MIAQVFAIAALCLAAAEPPSQDFTGTALVAVEGDILSVMRGDVAELVYLYGVDCPELEQPYGPEARQFTDGLIQGKQVKVTIVDVTTQTGDDTTSMRIVMGSTQPKEAGAAPAARKKTKVYANVALEDGTVLNQKLVEVGLAWWYPETAAKDSLLKKLNAEAMTAKTGLWADAAPVAPWDYRKWKEAENLAEEETVEEAPVEEKAADSKVSNEGVWVTRTSRNYHLLGCRYLDKSRKVMGRAEAEKAGFVACGTCFPEVLAGKETKELTLKGDAQYVPPPELNRNRPAGQTPPPGGPRPPAAAPAVPPQGYNASDAMALMARHQPRQFRDPSGNVVGITADYISEIPYASQIGLQDGDVVSMVNGVAIQSIPQAFTMVEQFKNARSLDVTIMRNGQPVNLTIPIK